MRFIRWLDKHGWCPDFLIGKDPNYSSVFISNLGSIHLKSGYHHLTNWGTSSLFCIIGEKKWTPLYDEHGLVEMQERSTSASPWMSALPTATITQRACAFSNIC